MPAFEESFLSILGHALPTIGLDFKIPALTDVGEVRRDGAELLAASGDLDHDFRGASTHRAADLLDLRRREAPGLRRPHPSAAEQIQVRRVSEPDVKGTPTH